MRGLKTNPLLRMRSADRVLRKMRIEDRNPASSGDDFLGGFVGLNMRNQTIFLGIVRTVLGGMIPPIKNPLFNKQ